MKNGGTDRRIMVKQPRYVELYHQLKNEFHMKYSGKEGMQMLPGEREICQKYQASRPTVRKALELLSKEDMIQRIQGKGTFYIGNDSNRKVPMEYYQSSLAGDVTSSKVLKQNIEKANEDVAAHLNIEIGNMVIHLQRIRYTEDMLACLVSDFIPYSVCPSILDVDFTEKRLLKYMVEKGIKVEKGKRVIAVEKSDEFTALLLGIKAGEPVMVSYVDVMDDKGCVVSYAITKSNAYTTKYGLVVEYTT